MKQIIPLLPLLLLLRGVAADINETQNIEQSQRHYLQWHRENVAEEVGERDINRSLANPPGINNNRGNKPGINRQHKRGNAPGINRNQSSSVSHHRGANKRNIVRQQNRKNNIQYKRHKKRGNAYRQKKNININNGNGRGRGGMKKKKNQMRNRYGSISVEKNTAKSPPPTQIQDLTSNTSGKKKPMLPYPPQSWYKPPPPNSWNPSPPLPQGAWRESIEEYSVSSKSYKQRGKGKAGKHRGGSESSDVNANIGWQQYSPPPAWKKPSWSSINWNRPPTQWISPTTWEKPPQYHPSNSSWKPPPKMEPEPISWEPQQELEAGTTSRYTSPSGIKMCPCENKPKMPLPQSPNKMMPYSTKNTAKDPSYPILSGGKAESHADTFANNNKKDRKQVKKHIRESGGTRQEVKDYESNGDSMRLLSNWGGPSNINGIPLLCPCKTQPPTATPTTYMPTTMEPEEIPQPPSTYFPTWSPTTEATTNKPSPKATTMFPSFSPTYSLPTYSPSDLETDKPVKPVDTMIPTYSPTSAYPTFSPSVSEEEEVVVITDKPTVQPSISPIADEVETTEPSTSPVVTASLPTYSPTYKWPTYAPTGATTTSFSPTTSSVPSTSSPTSTSSPSFGPTFLSEDTSDIPSFIDTPSPILSMTPPPTSGTNSTEETTMSPTVRDSSAPTVTPFPTTSSSGSPEDDSLAKTNSPSSLTTTPSDATQSTSPSVSTIGTASPSSLLSDTQSPSVTYSASSKSQACPDELVQSYNINTESTLYYAMVPSNSVESNNGILCARLEVVNNNDGWISVGFSPSGTMENSQAIIGIYDEDTVLKYDLAPGQATQMSDDTQTLQDASITTMDGKTIMEFTKLLVENDDEVEILEDGENIFLHAWGGSTLGYHTGRLSFTIDFSESNEEDTSRPIPPPIDEDEVGTTNSPTLSLTQPPVTDSTIELVGQLKSESGTEAPTSWYPTYYPTVNTPEELET